jgi:glucosylceramidase
LDWDHNWDDVQSPLAVLANEKARPYIAGVAWHCYGGEVQAQAQVHAAYPDKETYFTECSGGEWKPHWKETLPWYMKHLIIGTTRNWAKGVLLWNLALDENHGPHLGGCKDCRGVVTINSATGQVTKNFDYYALAHASRFVRQGANRIESSFGTEGIETVAFQNADDQSIALIVLNGANKNRQFSIQYKGKFVAYELPPASVMTLTWQTW